MADENKSVGTGGGLSVTGKAKDAATKAVTSNLSEENKARVEKAQKVVNAGSTAVKGAKAGTTAVSTAITVFSSPITWVILGVILVFILVFSALQVFGKTENADGCFGIGGDTNSSSIESSEDGKKNAENVGAWLTTNNFKFLDNKPMTKEQAAAVVGNGMHETGGTLSPKTGQSGMDVDNASNSDIKAISGSGKAVGIFQWDSDRRGKLADFADSKGGKWNDLDIQLQYLKKELDEDGYGAKLVAGGFDGKGKKVDELVDIYNQHFEGSGDWDYKNNPGVKERRDKRVAFAEDFASSFSGGGSYSSNSGGSCRESGSDVDSSDLTKLAVSMSYPMDSTKDNVTPGDSYGKDIAKKEYKDAKEKAQKEGGKDPMPDLYASCDRFVATVIKLTTDKDIPWGSTSEQESYLSKSPKWERYSKKSDAKPGDIWITKQNGHVILYLGKVDGKDTIAHASYLDRVAGLDPASYIDDNLKDSGGREYWGYHFKGKK